MRLSVLIPVYNAEKYIDDAVSSVMDQSFEDFELILADDGSSDSSPGKCAAWAEKYPGRVRFVPSPHRGPVLTRRRCFEESSGDFLYLMDADDALTDRRAFEKIIGVLDKTGCDMAFFNAERERGSGRKFFSFPAEPGEVLSGEKLVPLYNMLLRTVEFNYLWNKVFRRELVDWDTDYSRADVSSATDAFQILPVIGKVKSAVYIDEIFYWYRDVGGSIVNSFNPRYYDSWKKVLERRTDFYNEKKSEYPGLAFSRPDNIVQIAVKAAKKAEMVPEFTSDVESVFRKIGEDEEFSSAYEKKSFGWISKKQILITKLLYDGKSKLLFRLLKTLT